MITNLHGMLGKCAWCVESCVAARAHSTAMNAVEAFAAAIALKPKELLLKLIKAFEYVVCYCVCMCVYMQ
jgi:hypothetical protein